MAKSKFTTVLKNKIPRMPTIDEKKQLLEWLYNDTVWRAAIPPDEIRLHFENLVTKAYIAVFRNYTTGVPGGYSGKLMAVVWGQHPKCVETFTWDTEGQLQ